MMYFTFPATHLRSDEQDSCLCICSKIPQHPSKTLLMVTDQWGTMMFSGFVSNLLLGGAMGAKVSN